jgi:hypothetical protein
MAENNCAAERGSRHTKCRLARTAQSTSLLKPTAWGGGCSLFATPFDEFPQQLRSGYTGEIAYYGARRVPQAMAAAYPTATVFQ